ncbi:MAG: capsule assembly Wzi family protein [Ignavibacterium sp.]|nr:capsule assembly Wzi family protein [Ignavibacterium sp.]MDW8374591.1 capsule assembly Wzi family protein [Ignavibacteriales bacterium]
MKIIFLSIVLTTITLAQVVYEPLHRDVYSFLSRIAQKGLIEYDDLIRPLTRKYIAEKISELNSIKNKLTPLEIDELEFYNSEFGREKDLIHQNSSEGSEINYLGKDNYGRIRLFSYRDKLFSLNVSPIFGATFGSRDGKSYRHIWNGLYFYGNLAWLGFSFDFRDNNETGETIDKFKTFTPVTGTHTRFPKPNQIEYAEAKTVLGLDWSWGSFSFGRDFMEWGYGKSGLLVLSQKAPSFPFLRLDIHPVDWLSFNYFHAFLSSDVVDSQRTYYHSLGWTRTIYRDKFLASHTLTLKPFKGLSLSFGESVVYSDKLEFSYLFPLMFYRVNDHNLSRQSNDAGSNSQFFFNLSSRNHIPKTHLYGTIFIDEITIANLFDKEKQRNQFAFSLGASTTDLPINNLTFHLEYTKIYPFVYSHYIQTQTYQHASYPLGHWMGYNADQIYASLNYRIIRGLQTELYFQYIRKGDEGRVIQQYVQPQPPFLFGLRKNYSYFGGEVKYEIIHELFARFRFQSNKISTQQPDLTFIDKNLNEFYFSLYYGL